MSLPAALSPPPIQLYDRCASCVTLVKEMVALPASALGWVHYVRQVSVLTITHRRIGLAILSAVRFLAHCVMAIQLERSTAGQSTHPAMLLGTMFELEDVVLQGSFGSISWRYARSACCKASSSW